MDPFWSVAFCLCAVGSEGDTGNFSPETALLAALAHGQTSCSVSCITMMFLEVSEINRTPCSLLCWAGHQGTLFLQRRMGKILNVALQIWLSLKSEEPFSSAGRNSGTSAASSAPALSADSCSMRGELETNFKSETSVVRKQTEAQAFYTPDSFLSQRGCSWVCPGVMGSKSSLNPPMEPLDCEKNVTATQSNLGLPTLPVSSASTHPLLP